MQLLGGRVGRHKSKNTIFVYFFTKSKLVAELKRRQNISGQLQIVTRGYTSQADHRLTVNGLPFLSEFGRRTTNLKTPLSSINTVVLNFPRSVQFDTIQHYSHPAQIPLLPPVEANRIPVANVVDFGTDVDFLELVHHLLGEPVVEGLAVYLVQILAFNWGLVGQLVNVKIVLGLGLGYLLQLGPSQHLDQLGRKHSLAKHLKSLLGVLGHLSVVLLLYHYLNFDHQL